MKFFLELIKTVVTIDGQLDAAENSAINLFTLTIKNIKPGNTNGFVFV